jgi:integrase
MGREVSEKSHHSWRSFDDVDMLSMTETVYRGEIRLFGKTDGSLTDVHLPPGLAEELRLWEQETAKASPHGVVSRDAFIFPNSRGGFMDTGNYRNRVLNPLAERLEIPKLNFQILRRTMATQAQSMG